MNKRLSLAAGFVLLSAVPLLAQHSTATIRGVVTDPTGAVVSGAKVTIKNEETGLNRSQNTNASGIYSFSDLPVGNYKLEVEYPGFKSAVRSKIELNVADVRAVDLQLETGDISEVLTIESPAVAVATSGGEVAGLITGEQVRELPLNGRNFLQLATLMPGVSAPDFLNVKDKGLLGGSDLSVSGAAVTANLWTVDGANNNDVGSNRTILVYPSVDAIEEFKVHRNSYGAEFGQAAGAQINIVTRGGTNEYHGSAFYFGRNDALNATNYFIQKAGQEKDQLSRHDFGWNLGGPIIKDKLHFFASQEWNREKRGTVRTAFVPTAAERAGDFSGPAIPGCTNPTPVDPLTGAPFPGNRIPADRLSRGGLLYLQLYPLPNTTPAADSCNNWVASLNSPINWRQENVRLDWSLSDTTRLMLRYTQDTWTNHSPNVNSNLWGDDSFPAVDSDWDQPGKSFLAQLNHNVGSKGTNSLTFSYSGNKIIIDRGGTNPDLNAQILTAIPPVFPVSSKQYGDQTGHPVFWGGGGYPTLWNEAPFRNNQDLFILKDDYSAVFGKHFVKAGILGSTNVKNEDSNGNGSSQNSAFWGSSGLNGWGSTTGNILADFLLKDMTFGFSEPSGFRQVPTHWKDAEAYIQDSWKLSPRVTLDYGVRYSLLLNYYANDDQQTSFVPSLFNPALGADPCNGLLEVPATNPCKDAGFTGGTPGPNRSLQDQKYDAIAPRIGLAWDIFGTGKTAIRVGLGRFYLRERLSGGLSFPNNPPFGRLQSGIRKLDSNAEPCDGCFGVSAGAPQAGRDLRAVVPNTWQWNVGVQHEFVRNTILELSYVGSKGKDQLQFYDVNQVASGDINHNGVDDRLDFLHAGGDSGLAAEVRPYGVFGNQRIVIWGHDGKTSYHSLQSQLISRFGRGSQFQASYTWSKSLGNIPLDDSGGIDASNSVLDLQNRSLDYGPTRTNRTHIVNASLVLMLPNLENKSPFVKNVFGDWEVATIFGAGSGQALSVYTSGGLTGLNGGPAGTGYSDNNRPNRVAGVSCRATGGPKEQILNPAAFTLTGFQLGTIGDAGRGICEGPGYNQVDLSLYKNIKVTQRVKAQLRFEVFNVFNHVNFLGTGGQGVNVNFNPSSVTYDTGDPATATRITGFTVPSNFGQAQATRDARQAQFGLKLIF
jgi:Carboxypeptidase regulatory-like domain/TonB-dependent Receptor Plug Domain